MSDTLFVGIDLSARRGFDIAALDDTLALLDLCHVASLDLVITRLRGYGRSFAVAVDAPQALSRFPIRRPEIRAALAVSPPDGRYQRHRICDYELARRGIPLYLLPEPENAAPAWMSVGFATFQRLRVAFGLRTPRHANDGAAQLFEVYPFASFVTLLGGIPPRKTTPEGADPRLNVLAHAGVRDLPAKPSHDALDAIACAYTAWAWRHNRGSAVGDTEDGFIVLPVALQELRERYGPLRYTVPIDIQ